MLLWSISDFTFSKFISLLSGYETITSTLGFVTSLLAQHQDVQNKVREEVLSLSQQKESGYNEFLSGLKYLDFVIAEALRLWPQTTFIRRSVNLFEYIFQRKLL